MSRSYKNYPFISTGSSDKFLKRVCHKGLRHKSKELLTNHSDPDSILKSNLPVRDEIVNEYDYKKSDGYRVDMELEREFPSHNHFTKDGKLRK